MASVYAPRSTASARTSRAPESVPLRSCYSPFLYPPYPSTVLAGDDEAIRYFIESREPRFGCTMAELAAKATPEALAKLVASCQPLYELFATPGPFLHGDAPCDTDFWLASSLVWFGKLDRQSLLERILDGDQSGSLRRLYDAVLPLL